MVRLTDRPDMTLDVYRGRKTTMQQSMHLAVRWIVGNSPGSHANNVYSPCSDKLTEVQLYMST